MQNTELKITLVLVVVWSPIQLVLAQVWMSVLRCVIWLISDRGRPAIGQRPSNRGSGLSCHWSVHTVELGTISWEDNIWKVKLTESRLKYLSWALSSLTSPLYNRKSVQKHMHRWKEQLVSHLVKTMYAAWNVYFFWFIFYFVFIGCQLATHRPIACSFHAALGMH